MLENSQGQEVSEESEPQIATVHAQVSSGNDGASSGFAEESGEPLQSRPSSHSPSIFSSGSSAPPTLSIDSPHRTPLASNSSRTLTALARPTPNSSRRTTRFDSNISSTEAEESSLPRAEKDADDPTTPVSQSRYYDRSSEYNTLATLSKLFTTSVSPVSSRAPSYNTGFRSLYPRSMSNESASLPEHLHTRGLLEGRHSDITVCAFGQKYALHRLILDRAPFFTTALSAPWLESSAREISLHPEEIDPSITRNAFEIALKRLYGCNVDEEEDAEAVGLFATGCWLEMQGLVDSSIEAILRQMSPVALSPLIKLVTANYYGQSGERILSSAKSMLCRDGWEMPLRYWDGIPGDIVREIVGGDGFFVDSEWERWALAKRLLDRRLRQQAIDAGLIEPGKRFDALAPETLGLMAVRFDAVYRQNAITAGRQTPDRHSQWLALYTSPDIEPLLVLLDEGIHYIHLEFEQLQSIREARDCLGLPVLPEEVITNALWMQMELRQNVLNAGELELELGLSKPAYELSRPRAEHAKDKQPASILTTLPKANMESGSWDANGKPRKFWIPSADCNIVMGGNAEPVVTTSSNFHRHATRLSATMQPGDAQWATDFGSSPSNASNPEGTARTTTHVPGRPSSAGGSNAGQPKPIAYTHYPPFRFAAEFPNPRLLKEKKRVYSRTVFYAGSLWNIYIQKVRTSKNAQLGVYLHRAKEREAEDVIAGTAGLSQATVDERIGLLEREMLLRGDRRDRNRGRSMISPTLHHHSAVVAGDDDTSGSGGDLDGDGPHMFGSVSRPRRRAQNQPQSSHHSSDTLRPNSNMNVSTFTPMSRDSSPDSAASSEPDLPNPLASKKRGLATMPPYVDGRPTIRTYFKIYSPSKGGRLLSVYESAPDKFNFSQSWGWKSSTLMLDEGFLEPSVSIESPDGEDKEGDVDPDIGMKKTRKGDGKLRFMVVIGNL